ncbi:MAG: PHP domain-containing protein [Bacteroidota bacterium]
MHQSSHHLIFASELRALLDPPPFDLHLHTSFTDGRCSVREMLKSAERRGLERIAFTEHVRRRITWWDAFRAEVAAEKAYFPFLDVLVGIEAKALDRSGNLDADEDLVQGSDLVLGAVHGFPAEHGGFLSPESLTQEEAALIEWETSLALLERAPIDVLAHPGALTKKFFGGFPEAYLLSLISKAAEREKAIELNAEYNSREEIRFLLEACREAGIRVSLGSNAHRSCEVGMIQECLKEVL